MTSIVESPELVEEKGLVTRMSCMLLRMSAVLEYHDFVTRNR